MIVVSKTRDNIITNYGYDEYTRMLLGISYQNYDLIFHRDDDKPTITYYSNETPGLIKSQYWYKYGKKHRSITPLQLLGSEEDKPAVIHYTSDSKIKKMIWYNNGKKHRISYPAYIKYYPNGNIKEERWFVNGSLYRENNLPVVIKYTEDGKIKESINLDYVEEENMLDNMLLNLSLEDKKKVLRLYKLIQD